MLFSVTKLKRKFKLSSIYSPSCKEQRLDFDLAIKKEISKISFRRKLTFPFSDAKAIISILKRFWLRFSFSEPVYFYRKIFCAF